jgi:hypothetical protein
VGTKFLLRTKSKRVFTDSEYREVLKPDVMLLQDFPSNEKFNQNKFWSPAEDHSGKIICGRWEKPT